VRGREVAGGVFEREYQQRVRLAIGRHPHLVHWRQNAGRIAIRGASGVRYFEGAPRGAGDLAGFVRPSGVHVEIEFKGSRGRQSRAQVIRERILTESGCVYVLCEYDARATMVENVERAVEKINAAVMARVAR
jgi:hypothetical protein